MSKPKRTITRDSVFRDVGAADIRGEQETLKQGIAAEEVRTHQTAVWLGEDEIRAYASDESRRPMRMRA